MQRYSGPTIRYVSDFFGNGTISVSLYLREKKWNNKLFILPLDKYNFLFRDLFSNSLCDVSKSFTAEMCVGGDIVTRIIFPPGDKILPQ